MKKRLFSILLSLAMVITMMPAMAGVSFAGEANTTVPVELVKASTSGSKAVKLSWTAVPGATKYVVYGQKCGKSYKKLTSTSKTSYKVKKIKGKKLKAHKTYKFYVAAYSGSKKLATSKSIHFITGKTQGKYANAKSITVKPTSVTLESGKTATLKATTKIYKNKKHIKKSHGAATRYVSDNPTVASVNANGVVTAKNEGTATIYVQDIGGLYCKTTVTVKSSEPPAPTLYTVTFDMQGHGTQIGAITDVQSGTKITKPANPTAAGYTFEGWFKEATCENAWNFDNDTVTSNTTLYAKWTENPVPPAPVLTPVDAPEAATGLIYNGQEQTGVTEATGYTVTNGKATGAGSYTATATLADGYKWSDDTTAAKQIEWSIAKVALTATADDKSVTVGEEAPEYTVSYTGWVNSESIETVTPITAAVLTSEYTTASTAGEYDIAFETEPEFANYSVTTVNGKLTAAAPETYSVTYDANGATSGTVPDAQTKTKDVDLTLATNTGSLAKTGYSFAGWNTASNGTGTHYDAGATYTGNAELTLYAEWVKTVADVLPEGFPTSKDTGWKNENEYSMFINGDNLVIYTDGGSQVDTLPLGTKLAKTQNIDRWYASSYSGPFYFNMSESNLISIEYLDYSFEYEDADGTYTQK